LMSSDTKYTLFHAFGCGSTLVIVLLRLFDVPHEIVELNYQAVTKRVDSPELKRLLAANPLAQFPTLITPEGTIMTETAAIALYLNDRHGAGTTWGTKRLSATQLASFYRWLVFIPANVYPTVTIIEFPQRYVAVPADAGVSATAVQGWVAEGTKARREDAWKILEQNLGKGVDRSDRGRFLLGTERPTILDVYVTLLAHWTPHPRYAWFEKNCPSLHEICKETLRASSLVRQVFEENDLDGFLGKASHAKLLDDIP